jgi:2-polyprenyl-3-methyl-5-hydroxy-6-metoxy-1,4-benzoquinol methylase
MAERGTPGERPLVQRVCPFCGGRQFIVAFTYDRLMPREPAFAFAQRDDYWREIHRCLRCGHFLEWHELDAGELYARDYVASTYGDAGGLQRAFERIQSLPVQQSDNAGRVARILEFAAGRFPAERFAARRPRLLDVGSGLCVFAARMKEAGWQATVLDLDPRLIEHARRVAGVDGFVGRLESQADLGRFDLVTFNKVLEHVADPAALLASAAGRLEPGGFVYLEVPDGEAAAPFGREREEFLLGHVHVFSPRSLALLAERAGLRILESQSLCEPSSKFTLRAFAEPTNMSG